MKRLVLGIACWSFVASAWAAEVYEYSDISRRSGGSTFEETNVNVFTDQITIIGVVGRLELEDIQVYTEEGYKADLITLVEDDSRNKVIDDLNGFFGAGAKVGEPASLTVYLPETLKVTELVLQIESWASGAVARVELSPQQTWPWPDPDPEPIRPPDPIAPICNPVELTDRILMCTDDKSRIEADSRALEADMIPLRAELAERDFKLQRCMDRTARLEQEAIELENTNANLVSSIRRNVADSKRKRRAIFRLENPAQKFECYVQSRNGKMFKAKGGNRVQLLQKLIRQCKNQAKDGKGRAGCSYKWNPNEKDRWGCIDIGAKKPPRFDDDRKDDEALPGEKDGKRGNRKGKRRKSKRGDDLDFSDDEELEEERRRRRGNGRRGQ